MSDEAVAGLAARQYSLFSRGQALALGMTPKMIERRLVAGRWMVLAAAVYSMPGVADSWRRRPMAACLEAGPGAGVPRLGGRPDSRRSPRGRSS